ncbi:hypothetical protein Ndes2526B_g00481 [Nannochloris sp. 'desiccata']|nr:hypothetical protein NADE_003644 [Chlorella desiccata (nom. nud.)]
MVKDSDMSELYAFRLQVVQCLLCARGFAPIAIDGGVDHPLAKVYYMLFRNDGGQAIDTKSDAYEALTAISATLEAEVNAALVALGCRLPPEEERVKVATEFDKQWKTGPVKDTLKFAPDGQVNHLLAMLNWLVPAASGKEGTTFDVLVPASFVNELPPAGSAGRSFSVDASINAPHFVLYSVDEWIKTGPGAKLVTQPPPPCHSAGGQGTLQKRRRVAEVANKAAKIPKRPTTSVPANNLLPYFNGAARAEEDEERVSGNARSAFLVAAAAAAKAGADEFSSSAGAGATMDEDEDHQSGPTSGPPTSGPTSGPPSPASGPAPSAGVAAPRSPSASIISMLPPSRALRWWQEPRHPEGFRPAGARQVHAGPPLTQANSKPVVAIEAPLRQYPYNSSNISSYKNVENGDYQDYAFKQFTIPSPTELHAQGFLEALEPLEDPQHYAVGAAVPERLYRNKGIAPYWSNAYKGSNPTDKGPFPRNGRDVPIFSAINTLNISYYVKSGSQYVRICDYPIDIVALHGPLFVLAALKRIAWGVVFKLLFDTLVAPHLPSPPKETAIAYGGFACLATAVKKVNGSDCLLPLEQLHKRSLCQLVSPQVISAAMVKVVDVTKSNIREVKQTYGRQLAENLIRRFDLYKVLEPHPLARILPSLEPDRLFSGQILALFAIFNFL